MTEFFHRRNECRICGSRDWTEILDLGAMPPANAFLKKEELGAQEKKFPLAVYFCNQCSLLQLRDVVDGSLLFTDYPYFTSASRPLAEHFVAFAEEVAKAHISSPDDFVVEIGSNDGTLLGALKGRCRVLGIDPAENVCKLAEARGVPTIPRFFSEALAREIRCEHGRAEVILANNVIAHIDDLRDVFRGIRTLLEDHGVFIFEAHWVGDLIGDGGFDQIYHEHCSYFSLLALERLVHQFSLNIVDVRLVPMHGQSLRVYVGKTSAVSERVGWHVAMERDLGLDRADTFLRFAEKTRRNKEELCALLRKLKAEGHAIAGYGAAAKGNTLLNYYGIGRDVLDFITDTTPAKQGRYTPGTHIPIHPPQKIYEAKPEYLFILARNYADSIIANEAPFRNGGGKFIIAAPEVGVI